jgi:hypothetical protein
VLEEGAGKEAAVARLAAALSELEPDEQEPGLRLLEAMEEILRKR